LTTQGTT